MKKTNYYVIIFAFFLCLNIFLSACSPKSTNENGTSADKSTSPSQSAPASVTPPQNSATSSNTAGQEQKNPANKDKNEEKKADDSFESLAPTIAMSFSELVGDNGDYSDVKDYPPAETYKLEVNIYYQVITVYKKDTKGEYSVPVRYMICSTGAGDTPTPTGTFKMGKDRFRFSKFETYDVFGQYWSQITRNIFFHSLLYTQKDAQTYTKSSYRNLGKRVSHGCIRMLVPDARWVYYYAAPGTVVEIVNGKKNAAMEEIKKKLIRAKLPSERPVLKKGNIPVTEPWPGYNGK